MPLVVSQLSSDLADVYSEPDGLTPVKAMKYAKAVTTFWDAGMAPGGGSIMTAMTVPIIAQALIGVWSVPNISPAIYAMAISSALSASLSMAIVSGGLYGIGPCVAAPPAALIGELTSIFSTTAPSSQARAQEEASAINNWTKTAMCFGVGVEAPTPIPKIGPIS